ncbi:MAG: hypothetical protein FD144_4786 [Rhodospirillaceae bacterium]|nr:MAG: hypothetical protein FD144_4786 [Rhodospirillaceae bacterium]
MARIRSVHPGFFTDESYVEFQHVTRLFLIGLLTECDDQGVFEWKPARLKMRLFPADALDLIPLLAELEDGNAIRRFEVDGIVYGAVRNFRKYQRPKSPNAIHPLPKEIEKYVGGKSLTKQKKSPGGGGPEGAGAAPELPLTDDNFPNEEPVSGSDFPNEGGVIAGDFPKAPDLSGVDFPNETPLSASDFPEKRKSIEQMEEGGGRRKEEGGISEANASDAAVPAATSPPDLASIVFGQGLQWLMRVSKRRREPCASALGKWRQQLGDEGLIVLLGQAQREGVIEPFSWMSAAIKARSVRHVARLDGFDDVIAQFERAESAYEH